MSNEMQPFLYSGSPISDARHLVKDADSSVIVMNDQQEVLGVLTHSNLDGFPDTEPVSSALKGNGLILEPELTLDIALDRLTARGLKSAPVVHQRRLIGSLTIKQIMQTYKATLEQSVRRTTKLNPDIHVRGPNRRFNTASWTEST